MRQPTNMLDSGAHQLNLPMEIAQCGDLAALVVGSWAAGERFVEVGGQLLSANVWFHFAITGEASINVRYSDQNCSSATPGQWSVQDDQLVARFGQTVIRSAVSSEQDGDVIYWMGEVLHRLPGGLPAAERVEPAEQDPNEPSVPNMRRTALFR